MKVLLIFYMILSAIFCKKIYSEVLIMIPVYNRPDLIELQYKTFNKFLKDDYTLMVFNDADNDHMQKKIESMCEKYNIICVRVPQTLHNSSPHAYRAPSSFRHGEVLQFAFENYGFKHNDIVTPFDSDMFLITDFSIREYLGDYDLTYINTNIGAGIQNYRYSISTHFGPINMPKLKNPEELRFIPSYYPNGEFFDTGENAHFYFLKYKDQLKMKKIGLDRDVFHDLGLDLKKDLREQLRARDFSEDIIQLIIEICDAAKQASKVNPKNKNNIYYNLAIGFYEKNIFLDYKHGTSYNPEIGPPKGAESVVIKDRILKRFINQLIN